MDGVGKGQRVSTDPRASETSSWSRLTAAMASSERTLASPRPLEYRLNAGTSREMNYRPWMVLPICEWVHILGLSQPDAQVIYAMSVFAHDPHVPSQELGNSLHTVPVSHLLARVS